MIIGENGARGETCKMLQVKNTGEADRYLYFLATPQVGTHQFTCMKNKRVLVGQLPYSNTFFFQRLIVNKFCYTRTM